MHAYRPRATHDGHSLQARVRGGRWAPVERAAAVLQDHDAALQAVAHHTPAQRRIGRLAHGHTGHTCGRACGWNQHKATEHREKKTSVPCRGETERGSWVERTHRCHRSSSPRIDQARPRTRARPPHGYPRRCSASAAGQRRRSPRCKTERSWTLDSRAAPRCGIATHRRRLLHGCHSALSTADPHSNPHYCQCARPRTHIFRRNLARHSLPSAGQLGCARLSSL